MMSLVEKQLQAQNGQDIRKLRFQNFSDTPSRSLFSKETIDEYTEYQEMAEIAGPLSVEASKSKHFE